MAKMTLEDVAREAGVSLATVDRVVNRRAGVHARTVERVVATIERLGYFSDQHASRLARGRNYDFHVILPSGDNEFMAALVREFREMRERVASDRAGLSLHQVDTFDGEALAAAIDSLPREIDGLALVALDHPAVNEAVNALADTGVPVVTVVSDVPRSQRRHFVGTDNFASGRTAASLVGRFSCGRAGPVGLIVGSLALRDHFDRRSGFEQVIASEYGRLKVLSVREARDDASRTEAVARDLLESCPDLVAIYNTGGGQAGVIAALERAGRANDVIYVAHELVPSTRRHLIRGTVDAVINQDAGHMARSTVRHLLALREGRPIVPGQERIRIDIFLRDNLP